MGIRPWIEELEGDSPLRHFVHEPHHIKTPPKHTSGTSSMWQHVGQKLQRLLRTSDPAQLALPASPPPEHDADRRVSLARSCSPKRVGVVGLPRMGTFRRQNSEKRDRLEPVDVSSRERRALSATRQRPLSADGTRSKSTPPPNHPTHDSAPVVVTRNSDTSSPPRGNSDSAVSAEPDTPTSLLEDLDHEYRRFPGSRSRSTSAGSFERFRDGDARTQLEVELDSKWILNLSMHFRDKSDREKFFVTYAETPTRWRRVTVSCDYRNADPGSLEMDLKELQYQRDKSIQIYESIRDSLPEIQFYNTVTNLKLETSEGRLHVHVTEDTNEIIPYPPKTSVEHILEDEVFRPREIRESELAFDSHISGFVYKVRYRGKDYIKKEIPGPDTVDEFLYEINALHALSGSGSVIQLEAIVVDDQRDTVKGLLISFAEQGALVDLLYDHKGEIPWDDRVRWAQQAVRGLSEIHEEGYVQGDFTLSNIVVDGDNNAKIIDINRRGCPVGWEPPEIAKKIQSNQRISMYIGEKSDLYQLGMTLWALAMDDDEPERHDTPLRTDDFPLHIPRWYSNIVDICLQPQPRNRQSAKELLKLFPSPSAPPVRPTLHGRSSTARANGKQYIEPSAAVEREDIERLGFSRPRHLEDDFTSRDSTVDPVFTEARSSSYQFDSGSSYVGVSRGRRPASNVAHLTSRHQDSGLGDIDLPEDCDDQPQIIPVSPGFDREYDEVNLDGNRYLVSRRSFDPEELDILDGHHRGRRRSVPNTLPRLDAVMPLMDEPARTEPPDCQAQNLENDEEIELEPNHNHVHGPHPGQSSITSGSTPRNSSSILAVPGAYVSPQLGLGLATADLAGFGGHPSLDEHSPHEPKKMLSSKVLDEEQVQGDNIRPPATILFPVLEDGNQGPPHTPDKSSALPTSEVDDKIMQLPTTASPMLEPTEAQHGSEATYANEVDHMSAATDSIIVAPIGDTGESVYHEFPTSNSIVPETVDAESEDQCKTEPSYDPQLETQPKPPSESQFESANHTEPANHTSAEKIEPQPQFEAPLPAQHPEPQTLPSTKTTTAVQ